MQINFDGILQVEQWIFDNRLKNQKIANLCAGAIALEIDSSDTIAQELRDNGYYSYETGLKDGQGHNMFINLYPEHFKS